MSIPTYWHWEGHIQARIAEYIQHEGWTLVHAADTATKAQGIDLLFTKGTRRLIAEVKGYPSTVYERGPKQGQTKPTAPANQARQWFSHALLAALIYCGTTNDEVALAFPDFGAYRALLEKTSNPLNQLGIGIYFVRSDGSVQPVLDHRSR